MRLRTAFLNVLAMSSARQPDPVPEPVARPASATPTTVEVEALLDLAVLMRDVWLPSAGFGAGADRNRSLVLAAMFRLFPSEVGHLADDCTQLCGAKGCGECPSLADLEHEFLRLDAYLRGLDRPAIAVPAEVQ